MAEFLTTTDTSAAIERVIKTAKQELVLISAYVYPRVIYLERLKDAADRGVRITLIFGKRDMDARVKDLFAEVGNLDIFFLKDLHAKCFLNETEAIVTSLNLLNGSEEKNREMGVRLDHKADAQAYQDCLAEVRSIRARATFISSFAKPKKAGGAVFKPFPKEGFCIRCRRELPCDPDSPLCYDDFGMWVRYKNPEFEENYCHVCGKENDTSMAFPLCESCNATYAGALKALNAKRDASPLSRPTWRARG